MKKTLIFTLLITFSMNSFAKDYPVQCLPKDKARTASETINKAEKNKLIAISQEIKKQWKKLQQIMNSIDFKKSGLQATNYKKWYKEQEKLSDKIQKQLPFSEYGDTNYEPCLDSILYATSFQEYYAKSKAIYQDENHQEVQKNKQELLKFLDLLP